MTKIEELIQILMGGKQNPMQQTPMLGASPAQGFQWLEDGSLRGVLGGIGREGGGALGALFGNLFGNGQGIVDLGGGNIFKPGTGFQQQAQGAAMPGMGAPMASGFNFGALFNSLGF